MPDRKCMECGKIIKSKNKKRPYHCSAKCKQAVYEAKGVERGLHWGNTIEYDNPEYFDVCISVPGYFPFRDKSRGRPKDFYVYGWLDGNTVFYIGRGSGNRSAQRHSDGYGRALFCETLRCQATDFKIAYFADNLTEEGARLVESLLISMFRPHGNNVRGMSRKEIPPLTLVDIANSILGGGDC